MQFITEHLKLTHDDVRKVDEFKNLTDKQADELIDLVCMFSEILYRQFGQEESAIADNPA
jgi:hypothetical protein